MVAATIDTLIGAARITWGGDDGWRYEHAVALKDLTLTSTDGPWVLAEGEQVYVDTRRSTGPQYTLWDHKVVPATHVTLDIPSGKSDPEKEFRHETPPPVTIHKNGAAYLASDPDPSASEYVVREKMNGLFEATIPASSVKIRAFGTSIPDHRTAPLRLMCFELFPYTAVHGGHMKPGTFFKGVANRAAKTVDGSVSWAGFLGVDMTKDAQPVDPKATFGRGDIIVFCNKAGWGFHTVIASGATSPDGEPMVYSIADGKQDHPVHWSLTAVVNDFASTQDLSALVTYVRVFTPRDPGGQ